MLRLVIGSVSQFLSFCLTFGSRARGRNTGNRPKGGRKRIRKKLEDEEEETRKKTGNEMEPPNAYLGIACLLVAPLVLPVSFFVSFFLLSFLPLARARREKKEEGRQEARTLSRARSLNENEDSCLIAWFLTSSVFLFFLI